MVVGTVLAIGSYRTVTVYVGRMGRARGLVLALVLVLVLALEGYYYL